MSRLKKEKEEFAQIGRKDQWNPYALQNLDIEKFRRVVDEILNGGFTLVQVKRTPHPETQSDSSAPH